MTHTILVQNKRKENFRCPLAQGFGKKGLRVELCKDYVIHKTTSPVIQELFGVDVLSTRDSGQPQ